MAAPQEIDVTRTAGTARRADTRVRGADRQGGLSALPPFQQAEAASTGDVLAALDASVADATAALNGWDDAKMLETWTLSNDGKTLMAIPRVGVIRTFLLNHWYHHRGQLVVYLRLLDVPVPSVYGPSADENPFAGAS